MLFIFFTKMHETVYTTAEPLSLRCAKGLAHKSLNRFAVVQTVGKVLLGMEKITKIA